MADHQRKKTQLMLDERIKRLVNACASIEGVSLSDFTEAALRERISKMVKAGRVTLDGELPPPLPPLDASMVRQSSRASK